MNYFNCDNQHDFKQTESGIFLQHIIDKIGAFETCQNLLELQNLSSEAINKNDTFFQTFLEHLIRDNLISKEEISEYLNGDKMKDFFKKNKLSAEYKEGTYTFNPNKFGSVEKSNISYNNKSFSKNEMNMANIMESHFNSIDLRDDGLTKKQIARISMNDNNNFLEKEHQFYSLDPEYITKIKEENAKASNNHNTSLYSDLNLDISSDNSKSDFEEEENRIKYTPKKTNIF